MLTAKRADFPAEVWIGKVDGQWPLETFGSEAQALSWAAQDHRRAVIGPIAIPADAPAQRAQTIPAKQVWNA